MRVHDLTREAWILRFREFFIAQVNLERGSEATEDLLGAEIQNWLDDDEWQTATPEEAVWDNLSYWEP